MTTLKQIADECGVSVNTVSRVLNGKNKETWTSSAKRSEEIRRVAERLQFRPNGLARAMRRGSFNSVAMIEPTGHWRSTRFFELYDGIQEGLAAKEFHLILERLEDEKLVQDGLIPRILREASADGMLVNYDSKFPAAMLDLIRRHQIPFVWINAKIDSDCVYPDDFQSSYLAVQQLLQLGHQRVAYFAPASYHYSAIDRREGYCRAMVEAGLVPCVIQRQFEHSFADHLDMFKSMLAFPENRPTAIVTYEAYVTMPLIMAATALGINIPNDLSVLTFAHTPMDSPGIDISTVIIPFHEIGQIAVEMLLAKIANPRIEQSRRSVVSNRTVGHTCVPPKR